MQNVYNRRLLGALFFFSGFAALLYQTVWIKRLSLQFGHSAWAVASVVGVFMAGLGLGSWLAGRVSDRIKNPVRMYGWIEIGVAVFGLLSWPLLSAVPSIIGGFYGGPLFAAARLVVCFLILLPPTLLMGASLPLLVVGVSERGSFEKAVGWFYGLNTLGSAVGVAAAGFGLLPVLGVRLTLVLAVVIGVIVAITALLISSEPTAPSVNDESAAETAKRPAWSMLVLASCCGFFGLFLEISWTRLLAPVLGSSTYTFSMILLVILAATAAGSLTMSRFAWPPSRYLSVGCALLATAAVFGLVSLPLVNVAPYLFVKMASKTAGLPALFFLVQGLIVTLLVFGSSFALGMALPCLVNAHRGTSAARGQSLGTVYAANTIGAIIGCLVTGFYLLPSIGVSKAVVTMCVITLMIAALFFVLLPNEPFRTRSVGSGAAVLFAAAVLMWWPNVNLQQLQMGSFRGAMKNKQVETPSGDLIFIKDGISSTVSVYRSADYTLLKVNGKTDASTSGDLPTQYLVGHLPMLFHVDPKRVGLIGYGSGATLKAVVTNNPRSVDVVELEPAVIETSPFFRLVNGSVLDDPRVKLHIEDGRTFLTYAKTPMDVIISEPTNPWIAGVSTLFTQEFYRLAKSRLAEGGVFCQWIQTYELSRTTLNTMITTLNATFPHVAIFLVNGDLICLASERPLTSTFERLQGRMAAPDVARTLKKIDITNAYDLLAGYYDSLPEQSRRYATAQLNTDDNSWLEYRAPLEMYAGRAPNIEPPSIPEIFALLIQRFVPDLSREQVARGISDSVYRLRPYAGYRIEQMADLFKNTPVYAELKKLADAAKPRAEDISMSDLAFSAALTEARDGKTADALHRLKTLEQLAPTYPGLHRVMGMLVIRMRDWDQAQLYLNRALEENPNDYTALMELGKGWLANSNVPAAIACFKRAVEANPVSLPARQLLNSVLPTKP